MPWENDGGEKKLNLETITRKLLRETGTQFMRAVLAGMYISLGAILMIACKANGMPTLVCGMAFSLGLWLVVSCNGELFTGNCLLMPYMGYGIETEYVDEGKSEGVKVHSTTMLVVKNLVVTYVGNAIGVLMMVLLSSGNVDGGTLSAMVEAKTSAGILDIEARGVLCNIAICLASYVASSESGAVGRLVACMLPVTLFVTCGWEHSIADMFLVMAAGNFSAGALALVAMATLGNIVGGWLISNLLQMSNDTTILREMDVEE